MSSLRYGDDQPNARNIMIVPLVHVCHDMTKPIKHALYILRVKVGVSGPNFSARTGDAWVNGEVRIGDRWYTHHGARRLKDPTGKRRKLGGFGLGLRRATFRLLHCSICLWASVDRYQKVFHQKQSVDSRALEIERTTLQCRALDIIVVAALQPTLCSALEKNWEHRREY